MALISDVKRICDRLANAGWRDLMLLHGIDIKQSSGTKLADELQQRVDVDRTVPGFADFSKNKARGIEAGDPAGSLFYHALASPDVTFVPDSGSNLPMMGQNLTDYPTLAELNTVENYIFAATERDFAAIRRRAGQLLGTPVSGLELAVAVFACEYRSASETPHQRFADLCLSRTGVARVGTIAEQYVGRLRGYVPFQDGDPVNAIRVLPCRYAAYIAAKASPRPDRFGPATTLPPEDASDIDAGDAGLDFWVPVHKLFNGSECISGLDLDVTLDDHYENQKIARLHERLEKTGHSSGFTAAQREMSPFRITSNLASRSTDMPDGSRLVIPAPHRLTDPAEFNGNPLTFPVPDMQNDSGYNAGFAPSLTLDEPAVPVRPYPEYAHVRQKVENGNQDYIGDDPDMLAETIDGGYDALNFVDHTADGWIQATVPELSQLPSLQAYSLIAAPDFFPGVAQRDVFQWWTKLQDPSHVATLAPWMQALVTSSEWGSFWSRPPLPLSGFRAVANINLEGATFEQADNTVTSIVSVLQKIDLSKPTKQTRPTIRHAGLSDSAAGFFAPGWDTSADRIPSSGGINHLSAYGLGSPFPEDAKLCAALSTFWPAVAPDTARTFLAGFSDGTVCPMTDEELGATGTGIAWDGVAGPRIIQQDSSSIVVRYPKFDFADYTINARDGRFSIALTSRITLADYTARIVAMRRCYRGMRVLSQSLQIPELVQKSALHVLSYTQPAAVSPAVVEAHTALVPQQLAGPLHQIEIFPDTMNGNRIISETEVNGKPSIHDITVPLVFTFLVGSGESVFFKIRQGDGSQASSPWQVLDV